MSIPKVIEDYISEETFNLYNACTYHDKTVDDVCFNALSLGYAAGLWVCRAAIKAYVNEDAADRVMKHNYEKMPYLQQMVERSRDNDQEIVEKFVQLKDGKDSDI